MVNNSTYNNSQTSQLKTLVLLAALAFRVTPEFEIKLIRGGGTLNLKKWGRVTVAFPKWYEVRTN